jgi:hypothetical protein
MRIMRFGTAVIAPPPLGGQDHAWTNRALQFELMGGNVTPIPRISAAVCIGWARRSFTNDHSACELVHCFPRAHSGGGGEHCWSRAE